MIYVVVDYSWFVDRSPGLLAYLMTGCLVGSDWLVGLLVGSLVGWTGWLVGSLVGWFVSWLVD